MCHFYGCPNCGCIVEKTLEKIEEHRLACKVIRVDPPLLNSRVVELTPEVVELIAEAVFNKLRVHL